MKTALYIGSHAKDAWDVRAGWAITRAVQRGIYRNVTHCEMIHAENADGTVTIASASVRDKGVRTKQNVRLTPGNWLIADVPVWSLQQSIDWFVFNDGLAYDWRGAVASVLRTGQDPNGYFCNECCAASVGFKDPDTFTPAQYAAIAMSSGKDLTNDFFGVRK